jgi:DnaJ like chaperone protein
MIKALLYILMTFFGFMVLRNLFNEIQRVGQSGNGPNYSQSSNNLDLDGAYSILGAGPGDSDEEIRRKYRDLAKKYHPDVIQGKDLAEDFITFANEKTHSIKWAYERIMEERKRYSRQ